MRILPQPPAGIGDADHFEQLQGAALGVSASRALMLFEHFGYLAADRQHGIERGHRLLEDHPDVAAADQAHLGLGERQQVAAVEQDLSRHDPSRRIGYEAQDRKRAHGLARAAFADHGHGLALVDGVRHAIDGAHQSRTGTELGFQPAYVKQWRHAVSLRKVRCRPDDRTHAATLVAGQSIVMTPLKRYASANRWQ